MELTLAPATPASSDHHYDKIAELQIFVCFSYGIERSVMSGSVSTLHLMVTVLGLQ